jgi:transcriptional regulator with XRE-family HTH domain
LPMIEPSQCRAARGLLDWTQAELAAASDIGISTLRRFEQGQQNPIPNNLAAIRRALEKAGVRFINAGKGGGPGVRLRR